MSFVHMKKVATPTHPSNHFIDLYIDLKSH